MTESPTTHLQRIAQDIADTIDRYPPRALALIAAAELIWAASVLVPLLSVIAALIGFSRYWMAIIPGAAGAISFLLLLGVCSFIAYQPSTYVARWRERLLDGLADRYKVSKRRAAPSAYPIVQDAD